MYNVSICLAALTTLPVMFSKTAANAFEWLQATYDKASDCFVINTPDDTASKFWIGGAGQHGKVRLESSLPRPLVESRAIMLSQFAQSDSNVH